MPWWSDIALMASSACVLWWEQNFHRNFIVLVAAIRTNALIVNCFVIFIFKMHKSFYKKFNSFSFQCFRLVVIIFFLVWLFFKAQWGNLQCVFLLRSCTCFWPILFEKASTVSTLPFLDSCSHCIPRHFFSKAFISLFMLSNGNYRGLHDISSWLAPYKLLCQFKKSLQLVITSRSVVNLFCKLPFNWLIIHWINLLCKVCMSCKKINALPKTPIQFIFIMIIVIDETHV